MTIPVERPALGLPGKVDLIDVSAYQARIDYKAVAAAGFAGAIVKASEGGGLSDRLVLDHLQGFRDVGMLAMPYGFGRPTSRMSARDQAKKLWDASGDTYACRYILDLETDEALSPEARVGFAEEWVAEMRTYQLNLPGVYSYTNYWYGLQPALGRSTYLRDNAFPYLAYIPHQEPWAPAAGDEPKIPAPWTSYALWQYGGTNGYRVPGVSGPCDRDLFNGDLAAFRAWLGLTS